MPTLSGTVKDSSGAFVSRLVRAFRKSDGMLQGSATSNAGTGAFSITVPYYCPHTVIAYDAVVDANTVLLMNMDGVDASTAFNEECGKTYTVGGNAKISTAQSMFGGSSALFDGTGDYVLMTPHADYTVGTGDFTLECFIKPTVAGIGQYIAGGGYVASATGWMICLDTANKLTAFGNTGGYLAAPGTASCPTTAFTHVALTRASGVYRTFVGGTLQVTNSGSTGLNHSINSFCIGGSAQYADTSASQKYTGYIDCLRLTKGLARYTSTFTPMTAAAAYMTSYGENSIIFDDVIPV